VTLEDIIEELVGDIYDEADEIISLIRTISPDKYEVDGDMSISRLLEQLDLDDDLIQTDYTTVGGWVTDVMERIPESGEMAETGIFRITASAVNEQTVEKIILEILRDQDEKKSEK
jgi:CBS domain containing-hemolysin-like protein